MLDILAEGNTPVLADRAKERLDALGKPNRKSVVDYYKKNRNRYRIGRRPAAQLRSRRVGTKNIRAYRCGEFEATNMLYMARTNPRPVFEKGTPGGLVYYRAIQRAFDNLIDLI